MNKQNFLTFKEDLKKSIEIVKISKRHNKAWWNDGFTSKEAQQEAIDKEKDLIKEIEATMPRGYHYGAEHPTYHMAYYIAKHQIDDEQERIEYVRENLHKMMHFTSEGQPFTSQSEYWQERMLKNEMDGITKILSDYGDGEE